MNVRDFINDRCIERATPDNPHRLPALGGGFYDWQFYTRAALYEPKILRQVTEHFFSTFEKTLPEVQIAGVESSSTPFLVAFVLEAERRGIDLNAFSIRKQAKSYGLHNWIEGKPNDKPVLLVDDITSETHATMRHAVIITASHGYRVFDRCYCLIHKVWEPRPIYVSPVTLNVESMFTLRDFELTYEEYHLKDTWPELHPSRNVV